jgi:hypothetical protein
MRPLHIGLALIVGAAIAGFWIFGFAGATIGAALMLTSLPPSYDPAIIWKEHQAGWHDKPSCYGSQPPNYGHQAEYDCPRCPHNERCHNLTRENLHRGST